MNKFRLLKADEIDVRIAQINKAYVSLLLYKDARVDMNILDETVGPMNWQKQYTRDNANCIVSIWDEDKRQWIAKEDTGTESYTEKEKGLASDSFKRACFNWGIGRELYTAPRINVPIEKFNIRDGKCYDTFTVIDIKYDDNRCITNLEIKNDKTRMVIFCMGNSEAKPIETPSNEGWGEKKVEKKHIYVFQKKCEEKNIDPATYGQRYGLAKVTDMTMAMFREIMNELEGK